MITSKEYVLCVLNLFGKLNKSGFLKNIWEYLFFRNRVELYNYTY